jgi:hypothetical protein
VVFPFPRPNSEQFYSAPRSPGFPPCWAIWTPTFLGITLPGLSSGAKGRMDDPGKEGPIRRGLGGGKPEPGQRETWLYEGCHPIGRYPTCSASISPTKE